MATLFEKRSKALDTLDEWQELITHFEISGHTFSYFPVLVPDESWAEVCRNKLAAYLSAQGKNLHILSFDNAEDFKLLTNAIFNETFEPHTEAVWITTPIPFEPKTLEIWKQAWRESMARLNQFRNKLTKNYPYTFLFVGGNWTHEITFNIAPDLWSIHSGIIRINPPLIETADDPTRRVETIRSENIVDKTIDTAFALRQAERLRGKQGAEAQFANLLLNASKLLIDKVEYRKALEIADEAITVYEHLVNVENRLELKNHLASVYNNKGVSLDSLGKLNEAIAEYDKAISILQSLVDNGRTELANDLAMAFLNKGVSLHSLGKLSDAIVEYDKAIAIRNDLFENGRTELANELATAYTNKGFSLDNLGKLNEAILEHDKAIAILKPLVEGGRTEFANALARAYLNKGVSLNKLVKLYEAIVEFDKAITIRQSLVDDGRPELANGLAMAYMTKGVSLGKLGKLNEAVEEFEKAIAIYEDLVEGGRAELVIDLAKSYRNKGVSLSSLGKLNEAIAEYEKVIAILKDLVDGGRAELANDLAGAYLSNGVSLYSLGKSSEAIVEYDKAISIWKDLVDNGRTELANDLASAFMNKGVSLASLGKLNEAIAEYDKAIDLREEMLRDRYFHILPNIAKALGNRLDTHRKAGNADSAEKDMRRLHELLEFTKQHKEIEHLGEAIQAEIDKWG
jgi:tetratricopeptide (TPR) repeat protein